MSTLPWHGQAVQEGLYVYQSQHSDPQGFTGTRQGRRPRSAHFTHIPKGRSVQSVWDEVVGLASKAGVQLQRVMLYCVQRARPSWPQGKLCAPLAALELDTLLGGQGASRPHLADGID